MTDETDRAAELDVLRADVAALREGVVALRLELEGEPLSAIVDKERWRVAAADYWREHYVHERETA